jgi:DNA-binding SARP family transcriptional activator
MSHNASTDRYFGGPMSGQEAGIASAEAHAHITLLGCFRLIVDGHQIFLPLSAERVIVALAVSLGDKDRSALGSMLFPDIRRPHVSASLRAALWRAKRASPRPIIASNGQRLSISEGAVVDLDHWTRCARSFTALPRIDPAVDYAQSVEAFSSELLPSWSDDWLSRERQRWDHVRIHALERMTEHLGADGRHAEAIEAGLAAVAVDPYRETAHRALIKVYIAEGNPASALDHFHRYQRMIMRELGIRPTAELHALVGTLTT